MPVLDCPFQKAEELLRELTPVCDVLILDFHAEATSEKMAMGWYLDGRVNCIVGTHTHIQTADERILPGGQHISRIWEWSARGIPCWGFARIS